MKSKFVKSFIAIVFAWLCMNIIYAITISIQFGKVKESGVLLYWSGVYTSVTWIFFIAIPMKFINFERFSWPKWVSPILMMIYAMFVFTLLLGNVFGFGKTYILFLPFAALTGLIFGLILMIQSETLNKFIMLATPTLAMSFYFLFPLIMPSTAFTFMPDKIQNKIISNIIPSLKIGDSYQLFLKKLPNAFDYSKGVRNILLGEASNEISPQDINTSMNASNEFIEFDMEVDGGKITVLNYTLVK